MHVVITGGSGFVGLAVAEAVLRAGGAVTLFADRPPPPALRAALGPGAVELRIGDVRDRGALAGCLRAARPDRLVHAAAITPGPAQERAAPEEILAVNVAGTAAALRAAADGGIGRVLLVSSVAIYGPVDPAPGLCLDEDRPLGPESLYGISKWAAEVAARRIADFAGLALTIVRLGPVFGPFEHASGHRARMSPHWQVLRAAARGEAARLPWPLAADWVYSRDVGAGIAALLRAELRAGAFNLGSGAITDLMGWCGLLARHFPGFECRLAATPAEATVEYGMTRARAPLAIRRIREVVGFVPGYDLERAADDYVAWINRHRGAGP